MPRVTGLSPSTWRGKLAIVRSSWATRLHRRAAGVRQPGAGGASAAAVARSARATASTERCVVAISPSGPSPLAMCFWVWVSSGRLTMCRSASFCQRQIPKATVSAARHTIIRERTRRGARRRSASRRGRRDGAARSWPWRRCLSDRLAGASGLVQGGLVIVVAAGDGVLELAQAAADRTADVGSFLGPRMSSAITRTITSSMGPMLGMALPPFRRRGWSRGVSR